MNPIIRAMRANIARRDNWAQIRIGACALLLPPLTLGVAFYSMLATPDEGAAHPPGTALKARAVRPELLHDPQERAASASPQPAGQATWPIAGAVKAAPESRVVAMLAAGMRPQPSSEAVGETARVDPAPTQVTSAPRAALQQPPPGEIDSAPKGALAPEPSWSAPAEVSTALLPRALIGPGNAAPQMPTPRMATEISAVQERSAVDPRAAEDPPASPARRHARSEPRVRRNAPRQQREFSFKDWLQQIGILPHNTRG
jgi:hypothetical protein